VSGKLKSSFFFDVAPGNGYALRFMPPAVGPHLLTSVRLHFGSFGTHVAKGQVRLRIASVSATGGPADDNLLAEPILITAQTFQALNEPLTFTWAAIPVPTAGFFIVVEGLGDASDEYVMHSPSLVLAGAGNYQIARRSQQETPPRLLSIWSIPELRAAKPINSQVDFWMCGGEQPTWKAFPTSKQVPLFEVGLR